MSARDAKKENPPTPGPPNENWHRPRVERAKRALINIKIRRSRRSGFSPRRKRRLELSRFEKEKNKKCMLGTDGGISGFGRAVAMGYGWASTMNS